MNVAVRIKNREEVRVETMKLFIFQIKLSQKAIKGLKKKTVLICGFKETFESIKCGEGRL